MPEPEAEWDVLRDKDGKPITVTWEQVGAIWRAFDVWQRVYVKEKGESPDMANSANWKKSALLGRMLIEGRPPLPEAPPVVMGAPGYHLSDPDLCPTCGGDRDKPGRSVGRSIDQSRIPSMVREIHGEGKIITEWRCNEEWHPNSRKGLLL